MASKAYQIPVGGKTGRLGALTLLTSRVVHVGGSATHVTAYKEADTPQEASMIMFMTVMLCSYILMALIGALVAWCCWKRTRRNAVREVLVVGPERTSRSGQPRTRTPLTNDQTMAECCKQKHNVKSGRNQVSIFVTCLDCHHHATWLKVGAPTFTNFPDLRFMQQLWDAMQEQGQQSSASAAAAYAEYSGRQPTTRVAASAVHDDAAAAPVAAATATADAETETLTATVTVIRPRSDTRCRATYGNGGRRTRGAAGCSGLLR